jgi:predicted Zn-dependent protease
MSGLTALTTAVALAMAPMPALAQSRGPAGPARYESEQLLREYTRPILRAAGMEKQNIQMVIVNESAFNAFGRGWPAHLRELRRDDEIETPNQIIGVLAHETGHLAGGHLSKLREQWRRRRPR